MPERVEFKIFTKMTKDSIIDFKKLINYAKSIGLSKVAITDYNNVYNFPKIEKYLKTNNIKNFKIIYGAVVKMLVFDTIIPVTILVRTQQGLKNLYKIITKIKTTNLDKYGKNVITKDELVLLSNGLLYGLDLSYIKNIYDDLEDYQIKKDLIWWDFIEVNSALDKKYLKRIINIAKSINKIIIASGYVCYLKKEEQEDYKKLFKDNNLGSYLKTTKEMLNDFNFLDENLAYEIVVTNPNKLASLINDIKILDDKCYLPKIKDSKNKILNIINKKLNELCGENIPSIIKNRINEELYGKDDSNKYGIINTNTESIFLISKKIVDKSYNMGYPLFVRGGVASSFIAYLIGITNINPLPSHYYCKTCKKFYFEDTLAYNYGIDMPDKNCPKCHNKLKKDGFNISYENFLGLNVEKIPDIDINFAHCIQKDLINYLIKFWKKEYTIKAGAICLMQTINAEEKILQENLTISNQEKSRLIKKLEGKLKYAGQHPGGVFLIPKDKEIYDFTPCNYLNNSYTYLSTHFDYHDLNSNIIKFDILGHRIPSLIKKLEDLTLVKLDDIPLNEKDVFDLINKGNIEDLFELDDDFAKSIINIIKPNNFSDLVNIIGILHGNGITNKIKKLSKNKELIKDIIVYREDILSFLIKNNIEYKKAYEIMNFVGKDKINDLECWDNYKKILSNKISDEDIYNLENIGYVPLKAHVISYALITYKFAWYKTKFPIIFSDLMKKYQ